MPRRWSEWTEYDGGDGWMYYYNETTEESMWEMPIEVREKLGEMQAMLKTALAFSGEWGAFDAGFGTIYYFHLPSKKSTWERPREWGQEREMSYAELAIIQEKKQAEEEEEKKKVIEKKIETTSTIDETNKTNDIIEEDSIKTIEEFRQMLREKQIMPYTKWEAALPRIAIDERFRIIQTMNERRAIFEHFVKNRKAEMAKETKQNMKNARKIFLNGLAKALEEYPLEQISRKRKSFDAFMTWFKQQNPTLYESLGDVQTILSLSDQEKVYKKKMDEWHPVALLRHAEEKRLKDHFQDNSSWLRDKEWDDSMVLIQFIERWPPAEQQKVFEACKAEFQSTSKSSDLRKYGNGVGTTRAPSPKRAPAPKPSFPPPDSPPSRTRKRSRTPSRSKSPPRRRRSRSRSRSRRY